MVGGLDPEALAQGAQALGLVLAPQQQAQLLRYGELLLQWSRVYNLTALRDPASILTHHLLDSLSIVIPLAREKSGPIRLLDVGSGAGLPGVVVAILRPDAEVHCLDAVAKKMAFVRQVAGELRLPGLHAQHVRVEKHSGQFDVISSRAFSALPDFFKGSAHLLAPQGLWLAMKGRLPSEELAELGQSAEADVFHVEPLRVPGLEAERCIVWARRRSP